MKRDQFSTEKFEEALSTMRQLGAMIVDNAEFPSWTLNMSKRFGDKWKLAPRLLLRKSEAQPVTCAYFLFILAHTSLTALTRY